MNFDIDEATAVLSRTPGTLSRMLSDLPEAWIRGNEGPETWSPFDIVGHLIQGEEADWIPRAKHILEHGETLPFVPFDRSAQFEASRGKSLSELLTRFHELREANLRKLREMDLSAADLERKGAHPDFGAVTMSELLATWVAHDLGHIAQISRVMAKQYRDAVGPWRAYLPIVTR